MAGEHSRGPWHAAIWRHSGCPDTVCVKDARGREIIGWPGFDGVPCTKAEIRANARLVARAWEIPGLEARIAHLERKLAHNQEGSEP